MNVLRRIAPLLVLLAASPAFAQREVTPEARIFREYRDGVVTVFGDAGHGSGFLVSADGLVLTNQHVVASSKYIRVQLNDTVKVAAKLLAEDPEADVAVLRVNPEVLPGVPVLMLAPKREELAFEGERVIAIGSPLNQTKIVTSGIVSKVEDNAIISDVNINPGNSGGPMLNMDAEVVAINTFGEQARGAGPGISGSISIYLVEPLLEKARALAAASDPPPAERLPVMPRSIYPLGALQTAALAPYWDVDAYDISKLEMTGSFVVRAFTPPLLYRMEKQTELELAEARRGREAAGGASEAESYSPFEDLKSWGQYTGQFSPVVILQIAPKVGQTTGSLVLNILGAAAAGYAGSNYRGAHKLEFKADLNDVTVERNGETVTEIQRGMVFVPLSVNEVDYYGSYYGKDLARAGVFVLDPRFAAPVDGSWPTVKIFVEDLKKPGEPQVIYLSRRTIERIWADFYPYREQMAADTVQLRATMN